MRHFKTILTACPLLFACSFSSTAPQQTDAKGAKDTPPTSNAEADATATAGGGAAPESEVENCEPTKTLDASECPVSQWVCKLEGCQNINDVSEECWCEPGRPIRREDCANDELFVCRRAYDQKGTTGEAVLKELECSCVPKAEASCPEGTSTYEKTADKLICDGPCVVEFR